MAAKQREWGVSGVTGAMLSARTSQSARNDFVQPQGGMCRCPALGPPASAPAPAPAPAPPPLEGRGFGWDRGAEGCQAAGATQPWTV